MGNFISEDQIEQAILNLLTEQFEFRHINCFTSDAENLNDGSGRSSKSEVVFPDISKNKAKELNPEIPEKVIDSAIKQLTARRYAMSPVLANQEIYDLMRNGIPVEYPNADGKNEHARVRVIDFNDSAKNDFLAVSQLWIKGERYFRRPDIIIYINGLPLVFIELKNSNIKLKNAYNDNLTNYKKDIPQLFQYNAICILSNAVESRIGSFNAGWEHFFKWLRIDDETEKVDVKEIKKQGTSIERIICGLFHPARLLDYIENFILYHNDTVKIIAQNHQFIGVNKAIAAFDRREEKQGRLGVFWHTQGSGKSFSMIFYARKIFRKYKGNYTFVIITDREDLDGQIYRNFLSTQTVQKNEAARPKDSAEMRKFLSLNKRIVFTLIHKFRWDKGKEYPLLSPRKDIIVIVDEAHRTQYKSLAENMRKGLPHALYMAFTGTPLLGRDRKTNAWFGDYISEYNFSQSIDDGATVPLFYEKRVPEVLIQNDDLSDEFIEILEDENLNPKQQDKLEREFASEIEVIKRDDRLETIAKDIAWHFPRRGYLGKGMVVCVDKFTCIKMYDKVQACWKENLKQLVGQIHAAQNDLDRQRLKKIRDYMQKIEMAVVISEDADEEKKFADKGLDIKPHRIKINAIDENGHDIEFRFKDPKDRLQLVFVCAMWLTGFDAPTLSTLYLDKPMKDHTLMQTIARANRVTSYKICNVIKKNGELVDYYNVFRNMKKALASYGVGAGGKPGDMPVREKGVLFELLDDALVQGELFCEGKNICLKSVLDRKDIFRDIDLFKQFANILLEKDEWKKEFFVYENTITALYEACKPEILGDSSRPLVFVFQYLRGVMDAIIGREDIDSARHRISALLDQSIITANDVVPTEESRAEWQIIQKGKTWDLSKINYEKLKSDFKKSEYKNIEIADLRAFIQDKLEKMIAQNATRISFAQKLQEIIDNYNSGASSTEKYFEDLMNHNAGLKAEEERHIREGLTEDELELFDLIKKDKMTKDEKKKVKLAAKSLLKRLIEEHPKVIVQDWFRDSQSQARVRDAVEKVLDDTLPQTYDRKLFKDKCNNVYDVIFDYATSGAKWAA